MIQKKREYRRHSKKNRLSACPRRGKNVTYRWLHMHMSRAFVSKNLGTKEPLRPANLSWKKALGFPDSLLRNPITPPEDGGVRGSACG